jgi:hypothetical protein
MATLLQVANQLGILVSKKAPKKTGNLRRQLKSTNTGRNILSGQNSAQAEKRIIEDLKSGTVTFEFNIDVSPPGAEYGQFWNDPTVSEQVLNQKTGNKDKINFAEQAYEDSSFQKELDTYIENLGDKIAAQIAKEIDKELG